MKKTNKLITLALAGIIGTSAVASADGFGRGLLMGIVAVGVLNAIFDRDLYADRPVYVYGGKYYYGGDYRNGQYYYNNMILSGGSFHPNPRHFGNNFGNNFHGGGYYTDRRFDNFNRNHENFEHKNFSNNRFNHQNFNNFAYNR